MAEVFRAVSERCWKSCLNHKPKFIRRFLINFKSPNPAVTFPIKCSNTIQSQDVFTDVHMLRNDDGEIVQTFVFQSEAIMFLKGQKLDEQ